MIERPSAVIIKYNPCTRYARGSECPFFHTSRKCGRELLKCNDPMYDQWYKSVKAKNTKCFYPKRILILENPGVPFFLYHNHHRAIVGEATVTEATEANGERYYWFDEFVQYPFPVQLEVLETDKSLLQLARVGRWSTRYVSKETVEEIRSLSKLPDSERSKLGRVVPVAMPRRSLTWKLCMDIEWQRPDVSMAFTKPVLDEARRIFSLAIDKRLHAGRSSIILFYASLYLASRLLKTQRTLSDVAAIRGLDPKKLAKCYRLLLRELNVQVSQISPESLIVEYGKRLDLSSGETKMASQLAKKAKTQFPGKAPSSLAATAVYIVCREKRTKKEIGNVFGVSEVTIRNLSKSRHKFN